MRDVAIVATAQAPSSAATTLTIPELLIPVLADLFARVEDRGVERADIDFWCHGSCDYLSGQSFSFVNAVDAIGAWPPIVESHGEADGAFALDQPDRTDHGAADGPVQRGSTLPRAHRCGRPSSPLMPRCWRVHRTRHGRGRGPIAPRCAQQPLRCRAGGT